FQHDESVRRLAPLFVGHADNAHFLNRWMAKQHAFDFHRRDVLAAADDDVFHAVANFNVSVGMHHGAIAGMKPSVADDLRGGFGILIVTFHDNIAANNDLAYRFTIVRNFDTFRVHDLQLAGCNQFHT